MTTLHTNAANMDSLPSKKQNHTEPAHVALRLGLHTSWSGKYLHTRIAIPIKLDTKFTHNISLPEDTILCKLLDSR